MTKIAFQALVPRELFEDSTDCLHRVVKPMLEAIREQMREKGIPAEVRISLMVDTVPTEAQIAEIMKRDPSVKEAVKKALGDGTIVEVH